MRMINKIFVFSFLLVILIVITGCKEELPIKSCYYLDLNGKQMSVGWKLNDFGYDDTFGSGGNWFYKHSGVVLDGVAKRNYCQENKSFIWICGDKTNDYISGEGIVAFSAPNTCEYGCNKKTGFCKCKSCEKGTLPENYLETLDCNSYCEIKYGTKGVCGKASGEQVGSAYCEGNVQCVCKLPTCNQQCGCSCYSDYLVCVTNQFGGGECVYPDCNYACQEFYGYSSGTCGGIDGKDVGSVFCNNEAQCMCKI